MELNSQLKNLAKHLLPRRILADLLGMRPETFSRALTALSERGAIAVTRTTLRIADQETLAEIAGGNGR